MESSTCVTKDVAEVFAGAEVEVAPGPDWYIM